MWCALNIPVLAMLWLHRTLTQAAITAGADAEVLGAVNVALPGAKLQESPLYWRVEGHGTPKAVALPEPRPVCHPDPHWWLEPRAALRAFRGRT